MFNRDDFTPCPNCRSELQITVYPALFRPAEVGRTGEVILTEGEASCFYHPQKKAVLPCEACGRFVCALCDCEHKGQHLCPVCLEAGRTKGKIKSLENTRTRYDKMALGVSVLGLIPYFTIFAAPVALYLVLRHWKSPMGLAQRSRARFVFAAVFALLQIAGFALMIFAIFWGARRR